MTNRELRGFLEKCNPQEYRLKCLQRLEDLSDKNSYNGVRSRLKRNLALACKESGHTEEALRIMERGLSKKVKNNFYSYFCCCYDLCTYNLVEGRMKKAGEYLAILEREAAPLKEARRAGKKRCAVRRKKDGSAKNQDVSGRTLDKCLLMEERAGKLLHAAQQEFEGLAAFFEQDFSLAANQWERVHAKFIEGLALFAGGQKEKGVKALQYAGEYGNTLVIAAEAREYLREEGKWEGQMKKEGGHPV